MRTFQLHSRDAGCDIMEFLFFALLVLGNATMMVMANRMLGPRPVTTPEKETWFECGAEHTTPPPLRYPVRFYRMAIAFVVLDVELAFFFPWAMALEDLAWAGFAYMAFYTAIVVTGYLLFWKKGGWQFWAAAEEPEATERAGVPATVPRERPVTALQLHS